MSNVEYLPELYFKVIYRQMSNAECLAIEYYI